MAMTILNNTAVAMSLGELNKNINVVGRQLSKVGAGQRIVGAKDNTDNLGDTAKADKCRKLAEKNGWTPISMRDDFKTIYGENVKRADKEGK